MQCEALRCRIDCKSDAATMHQCQRVQSRLERDFYSLATRCFANVLKDCEVLAKAVMALRRLVVVCDDSRRLWRTRLGEKLDVWS